MGLNILLFSKQYMLIFLFKGKLDKELGDKMGKAGRLFNILCSNFLGKKKIPKEVEAEVLRKVVKSTVVYGSEVWTLSEKIVNGINAVEIRFVRNIEEKPTEDSIPSNKVCEAQWRLFRHAVYSMMKK